MKKLIMFAIYFCILQVSVVYSKNLNGIYENGKITYKIDTTSLPPCLQYGYLLNSEGFSCGNEIGTFCIETFFDWVSPLEWCDYYVFEIEYPTGSFIYTDLGDFYLFYTDQVKTILRTKPSLVPAFHTLNCMEGVLQIPETLFTIRIVREDDPNDVFSTSTFTLDVSNTIGSNGNVTYASDAISQNLLLDPDSAVFTSQRIIIEGTLIFDLDYYFSLSFGQLSNEIIMAPGAKIEVLPGITLSTRSTNIYGCNGLWDRIELKETAGFQTLYTTISDAHVAVELKDQSFYASTLSTTKECNLALGSFGTNSKEIQVFLPSRQYLSWIIQDCIEGARFENVSMLNLNGYVIFNNIATNGIYLDKTDLTATHLSFNRCTTAVNVGTYSSLLSLQDCSINYCTTGVSSSGNAELIIEDCSFAVCNNGIIRSSAKQNEHSLIKNNFMNCGIDIFATPLASRAEIQSNIFQATSLNILLAGLDLGDHRWAIQHNTDFTNSSGSNILFNNVNFGRIFRNPVVNSTNNTNLLIYGGTRNIIDYNNFHSDFSDNVFMWGTPSGIFACNELSAPAGVTGLTIMNNCSGTDIRGNTLIGADYNLGYGSPFNTFAHTGVQEYKGNLFDQSSVGNEKAINYSNSTTAALNQYFVGFWAGSQGSSLFPYFIASINDWFIDPLSGLADYTCPPGIINPTPGNKSVQLKSSIVANTSLLSTDLEEAYGEEVGFDAKLKLSRALRELSELEELNQEEQSWYEQLSSSDFFKFMDFEATIRDVATFSETEENQSVEYSDEIEGLLDDINQIEWYQVDEQTGEIIIDEEEKDLYDELMETLRQKSEAQETLLEAKQNALINSLNELNSILSGIGNQSTHSGQNLKTVYELLLKRYVGDAFSTGEVQTLTSIANECVGEGGEGVYIARSLLAEINSTFPNYTDDCIQELGQKIITPVKTRKEAGDLPEIYPNPVKDYVYCTLPENAEVNEIKITDLLGTTVATYVLENGQQSLEINTTLFESGIYFLNFGKSEYKPKKFVISR